MRKINKKAAFSDQHVNLAGNQAKQIAIISVIVVVLTIISVAVRTENRETDGGFREGVVVNLER